MSASKIQIDLEELQKLCAMQCTDQEVAAWFGVSTRTIERRRKVAAFNDVMEQGKAKGRISLRRNLWKLANAGNPAANIFLSKNLLGYRDVMQSEHSGPNGRAIAIAPQSMLDQMTDEDLQTLITTAREALESAS